MRFNILPLLILLLALQQAPAQVLMPILQRDSLISWFPSPEMEQLIRQDSRFIFRPYKLVGKDSLLAILRSALHIDTADVANSSVRLSLPLYSDVEMTEFRLACYTEGRSSSLDSAAAVENIYCNGINVEHDFYFLRLSFEGGSLRASMGVPLSTGWYSLYVVRPISEALTTPHLGLDPYYMIHGVYTCGSPELSEYIRENMEVKD